jgi:hypothetical protein
MSQRDCYNYLKIKPVDAKRNRMANLFSSLIGGEISRKLAEVSVPNVELRVVGGDHGADEATFRVKRFERQGLADRLKVYFPKFCDTEVNSGHLVRDEDPLPVAAKYRRRHADALDRPFIAHDDLEAPSLGSGHLEECRECFGPKLLAAQGGQQEEFSSQDLTRMPSKPRDAGELWFNSTQARNASKSDCSVRQIL